MRKNYFFLLFTFSLSLISIISFAQIPNSGFENWYTSSNGLDPVDWVTSNASPYVSVEQATPAYQGSFAVKVKTWQAGIMVAAGFCQTNGFNFSSRPAALSGFVKCTIMAGDSASIFVTATLGGSNGNAVGAARKVYSSSLSSFTSFNLPINYTSASNTDTIYIDIFAGKQNSPSLGTEIIIDQLALSVATGIENTKEPVADFIGQNYPNPSNEFTTIPLTLAGASNINIKIYDLIGREIKTIFNESLPKGEHQIKFIVADLPTGIYYYAVKGDHFAATRKFSISK